MTTELPTARGAPVTVRRATADDSDRVLAMMNETGAEADSTVDVTATGGAN